MGMGSWSEGAWQIGGDDGRGDGGRLRSLERWRRRCAHLSFAFYNHSELSFGQGSNR